MRSILARLRWVIVPVLVAGLIVVTSSEAYAKKVPSGTLNGSGATFPAAFYQAAIQAMTESNNGLTINYNPTGSGAGQTDLQGQLVDFAGSDSLVKPEDVTKFKGGKFLYFPTVAAPITASYNLSGVKNLQLSPDTVAKIFQREITTWNDPAIKADNPNAQLPNTNITVAHRSDSSGTTANFTAYLVKAAPTAWKLGTDKVVNWPAATQGAEKNTGVAQIVKSTNGAVGYVDLSDAKASGLVFARIKNQAGRFVAPTVKATSSALAGARVKRDLTFDPLDAPGKDSYPITAGTYLLVYQNQSGKTKAEQVKGLVKFILTDGQALAPQLQFAPLPKALRDKAIKRLNQIKFS